MHISSSAVARATAVLLLATAVPHAAAQRMYSKNSPVLQVDAKSWDKAIINSHLPSNLKPAYEKAASSLSGIVQVAAVNCDDDANKGLCGQLGIQGFPTIKTVRPAALINSTGKDKDKDKDGKKKKGGNKPAIADYRGERSARGISDVAKQLLPNLVARVTDADVDEWLETNKASPRAILFSDKGVTSALLKSLALDFRGSAPVAQVRGDREDRATDLFGVETYPTFIVIPAGGDGDNVPEHVTYDGEMNKADLFAFLKKYAEPVASAVKANSGEGGSGNKAKKSPKAAKSKAKTADKEEPTVVVSEAPEDLDDILESVGDTPTAKPKTSAAAPPVPLSTLSTPDELSSKCLGPQTGTCVLALLPADGHQAQPDKVFMAMAALADLNTKLHTSNAHAFPLYAVADAAGAPLRKGLGLDEKEDAGSPPPLTILALNGRRKWVRHYDAAAGFGLQALEAWIDGVKLGDVKKEKLPADLIVEDKAAGEKTGEKHDEL